MRVILNVAFFFLAIWTFGQMSLFEYNDVKLSTSLPKSINSERSVVIVQVPDKIDRVRRVGDWEGLSTKVHKAFVTMGIDAVTYVNQYDLIASPNSKKAFSEVFVRRDIKNIIFLKEDNQGFHLIIAPFNGKPSLFDSGVDAYGYSHPQLYELLLETGRNIRRANHKNENFLIPTKPNFSSGISIVEKTVLKNYPGILRRSKLSVERFSTLELPKNASSETVQKIASYNQIVEEKNRELDTILTFYPYEYEVIDPMTDQDLLRGRRQFVLRNISGQAVTLRKMLDYTVNPSETDFVSIIPIMPDQTKVKPISRDAIIHKFYIRQNISKNIHVGEWDADTSWRDALRNMIGNLIQEHNVDK